MQVGIIFTGGAWEPGGGFRGRGQVAQCPPPIWGKNLYFGDMESLES